MKTRTREYSGHVAPSKKTKRAKKSKVMKTPEKGSSTCSKGTTLNSTKVFSINKNYWLILITVMKTNLSLTLIPFIVIHQRNRPIQFTDYISIFNITQENTLNRRLCRTIEDTM